MKRFCKKLWLTTITLPFLVVSSFVMGSVTGISWTKPSVIPVVLVKPGIRGFEPVEGNSIGNTWNKSDVRPVLLVKPGIGGFIPYKGSSIGNTWSKESILPVMLVEPSNKVFVPLHIVTSENESLETTQQAVPTPAVIESQIDGEFEGWDGETIVKLTNGQIWQQIEYHYTYHYAYMPEVLIYESDSGKMKVEGVDEAVGVKRLK